MCQHKLRVCVTSYLHEDLQKSLQRSTQSHSAVSVTQALWSPDQDGHRRPRLPPPRHSKDSKDCIHCGPQHDVLCSSQVHLLPVAAAILVLGLLAMGFCQPQPSWASVLILGERLHRCGPVPQGQDSQGSPGAPASQLALSVETQRTLIFGQGALPPACGATPNLTWSRS